METVIEGAKDLSQAIEFVVTVTLGIFLAYGVYKAKFAKPENRSNIGPDTAARMMNGQHQPADQGHEETKRLLYNLKEDLDGAHNELRRSVKSVDSKVDDIGTRTQSMDKTLARQDERIVTLFNKHEEVGKRLDASDSQIRKHGTDIAILKDRTRGGVEHNA
mgnify:CR=1 FL=1